MTRATQKPGDAIFAMLAGVLQKFGAKINQLNLAEETVNENMALHPNPHEFLPCMKRDSRRIFMKE